MLSLALLLFACFLVVSRCGLSPYIQRGKGRVSDKTEKKLNPPRKVDLDLEKSLSVLTISRRKFQLWDIGVMVVAASYEYIFTRDILATLIYALVGRMLIRIYITFKAAHKRYMQDAQTQQFVRGIADNLTIGESILEATLHSGQRIKEPLRSQLLQALNTTRGNRTLPEAMADLSVQLINPVYMLLSRIIAKGLEKGQREIGFAFKQIDDRLSDGEKNANKRTQVIMTYFKWLYPFLTINVLIPPLMLLIKPDLWDFTTQSSARWAWVIGAIFVLYLSHGLKRFTRLYAQRGDLV
ncbi:type II secretion system F family protein [Desulfosporosinus shakirovi]|uniref:type II secretion system F family protein n=1 Tax=Desulfosporosinus shakirovi TaxID=2885154 RepID=UPI001E366CC6|nr:hypothetical protein [Desulfosporosinus sp. SRJS8]MCB8818334.1 hypothetical protein [Desulfosporosinus sp. SRJS8]